LVARYLAEGRVKDALITLYNLALASRHWSPVDAESLLEDAVELATRVGADADLWATRAGMLQFLSILGRFDETLAGVEPVLAWAEEAGDVFVRAVALDALARIDIDRGGSRVDPTELASLERSIWGRPRNVCAAPLAHARGDDELARRFVVEWARTDPQLGDDLVPLCIEVGLTALADELLEREVRKVPDAAATRAEAIAAVAGSRGDWAEAAERLRGAVSAWTAFEQPRDLAHSLQKLGRALIELDERDEGIARLREARELWEEMGATLRIAEIDRILAEVHAGGESATSPDRSIT
jgi:hypothetical protein